MSGESDFSDEDDVPLSTRNGKAAVITESLDDNEDGYRIKGALKAPRPTSYTTQALYDQMITNDIDLSPDYQREVVWADTKQIGLIDSIFRNFYVPPLIFAVLYRDDGSERRVCIDGKQRLTSIHRFMNGEIPYKDAFTNEKFVFKDIGKFKSAKILPERYRKVFRTKQIVCIEYQDLTNADEREIFQRVQLGMALTPAEKLQAISSPFATFIRELQSEYVNDGLAEALDWEVSRGGDFRCLTHAVYNMERWPAFSTSTGVSALQKMLVRPEELETKFQDQVHQTFQIFLMLATDNRYRKAFKIPDVKKLAPVEFIAIATLIHVHKYKLTLAQMSEAILQLRKDVRKKEVDIRMNARCMKIMLEFIRDLKVSQLKDDPDHIAAAKHRPLKRKRPAVDEDGEPVERKRRSEKKSDASALTASQAHSITSASTPTPPPVSQSSSLPRKVSSASQQHPTLSPPVHHPPAPDRLAAVRAAKTLSASDLSSLHSFSDRAASRNSPERKPSVSSHGAAASPSLPPPPQPPTEPVALRHSMQRHANASVSGSGSFREPPSFIPPPPPSFPPSLSSPRSHSLGDSMIARMMATPVAGSPSESYRTADVQYPLRSPHEQPYSPRPAYEDPSLRDRDGSYGAPPYRLAPDPRQRREDYFPPSQYARYDNRHEYHPLPPPQPSYSYPERFDGGSRDRR